MNNQLTLVFLLAAVTFATRAVGPVMRTRLNRFKRTEHMLAHMTYGALVSIVVGALAHGDVGSALAAMAATLIIWRTGRIGIAMAAGVAVAALARLTVVS